MSTTPSANAWCFNHYMFWFFGSNFLLGILWYWVRFCDIIGLKKCRNTVGCFLAGSSCCKPLRQTGWLVGPMIIQQPAACFQAHTPANSMIICSHPLTSCQLIKTLTLITMLIRMRVIFGCAVVPTCCIQVVTPPVHSSPVSVRIAHNPFSVFLHCRGKRCPVAHPPIFHLWKRLFLDALILLSLDRFFVPDSGLFYAFNWTPYLGWPNWCQCLKRWYRATPMPVPNLDLPLPHISSWASEVDKNAKNRAGSSKSMSSIKSGLVGWPCPCLTTSQHERRGFQGPAHPQRQPNTLVLPNCQIVQVVEISRSNILFSGRTSSDVYHLRFWDLRF